jgi:hypothetical protein
MLIDRVSSNHDLLRSIQTTPSRTPVTVPPIEA